MKKVINGKIYNTETAELIGEDSYSYPGDFHHWEAALYRTPRSHQYFLAGSGGPMSRFAQSVGQNEWSGGSDLIPLSPEDALAWAEAHLKPAIVEHYFADMIEEA